MRYRARPPDLNAQLLALRPRQAAEAVHPHVQLVAQHLVGACVVRGVQGVG